MGDTVHWVWQSNFHSTTSVKGSAEQWDSGVLNSGSTFDHTFTHAGTFVYYCTVHGQGNGNGTAGGMAGKIVVAGSTPTPTPTTPTPTTPTPTPSMGPLQASGQHATVKVNKTFHNTVAKFREPHTTPSNFTVLIDWGDQSGLTPGQIRRAGPGKFTVVGSHRYLAPGVFQVMVMIQDSGGQEADAFSSVKVTGGRRR